jgi:molybdopterin biosynthesis enzyme MoaB
MRCYEKTPKTFLSRGVAGTIKSSLVITLPGSKRGAVESLEAVCDILPHALGVMRGDIGDHGPEAR